MESKNNIDIKKKKKEWKVPELQIIPFKNTKGGGRADTYEDTDYFNELSPHGL
ncbi:MAG: hypothetical protein JXB19_03410 [Bacteroidales bacterium]|nr:hypothetical protein [Bacteroidales bacterium]